jgi:hypothetical protein
VARPFLTLPSHDARPLCPSSSMCDAGAARASHLRRSAMVIPARNPRHISRRGDEWGEGLADRGEIHTCAAAAACELSGKGVSTTKMNRSSGWGQGPKWKIARKVRNSWTVRLISRK